MHRLTARFLLLAALVGNFIPLALAITAAPPHTCCLRKAVHRCHDSLISETEQPVIRDASCCSHNCGHVVVTTRWVHAQPKLAAFSLRASKVRLAASQPDSPATAPIGFQSSRAPPAC